MKLSLFLLKNYIQTPLDENEIAEILTDIGLEVEGVERFSSVKGGYKGLVVGEVTHTEKHPNADRLKITKVQVGNNEELQIVCGAPNVESGQKVVVAKVGTTIYPVEGDSFEIKKTKIRGVESFGMICAEDEIGAGSSHDGIMVLPVHSNPGDEIKDILPVFEDVIFEIGLTPNRTDAMSHHGVAIDLHAALKARKKESRLILTDSTKLTDISAESPVKIKIEDEQACPVYSGICFHNLKVKPSPSWLQNQLLSIGVKPINNVVDITNLVLKELGQPLHAFDLKKVSGDSIIIRKAKKDESIITLDKKERKLQTTDLVICDKEKPLCIAGVMGGLNSGITEESSTLFLESAYFSPEGIRKTSIHHQLRSDAAMRYEKGADPFITLKALERAAFLLKDLANAEISGQALTVKPAQPPFFKVELRMKQLNKIAGMNFDKAEVNRILTDLQILIKEEHADTFKLEIPPAKTDVIREIDVIEEIIRIYGINEIPVNDDLQMKLPGKLTDAADEFYEKTAQYLSSHGFFEMNNNSISRGEYYPEDDTSVVRIIKSANAELNVLRKDLYHCGLEAIRFNKNRNYPNLRLFEAGKIYQKTNDSYEEKDKFMIWMTGSINENSWRGKSAKMDLFMLKSFAENILKIAGIEDTLITQFEEDNYLHSGISYVAGSNTVLQIGHVNENLSEKFDISQPVIIAEFNWPILVERFKNQSIINKEIPKYPSVKRDLAILIPSATAYIDLKNVILQINKKIIQSVDIFDTYKGKGIPEDKKSYAFRISFQHTEKTLTDKEVDKEMKKIIFRLEKDFGAQIRE
ncbi:MAG: phenylalanine--tRNA ligase subunit beta [Chitinophagaceae bacterium]|nr:MAG: phenylalanine--tRNA ligase subunit beta [Chitinophagaceae bacterium]